LIVCASFAPSFEILKKRIEHSGTKTYRMVSVPHNHHFAANEWLDIYGQLAFIENWRPIDYRHSPERLFVSDRLRIFCRIGRGVHRKQEAFRRGWSAYLQRLQESPQRVFRGYRPGWEPGAATRESLFLEAQIGMHVDLRGRNGFVSEPKRDHRLISTVV
jgi:hypothetical protein